MPARVEPPMRTVASKSEGVATCGACAARFTGPAWARLELSTVIAPKEVRELVLYWPDDVRVEVRVCGRCRGLIAMKRKTAAAG